MIGSTLMTLAMICQNGVPNDSGDLGQPDPGLRWLLDGRILLREQRVRLGNWGSEVVLSPNVDVYSTHDRDSPAPVYEYSLYDDLTQVEMASKGSTIAALGSDFVRPGLPEIVRLLRFESHIDQPIWEHVFDPEIKPRQVHVSDDGSRIMVWGSDDLARMGAIYIFDESSPNPINTLSIDDPTSQCCPIFTGDGSRAFVELDSIRSYAVIDLSSGLQVDTVARPVSVSADGQRLIVWPGSELQVLEWDSVAGRYQVILTSPPGVFSCARISSDGSTGYLAESESEGRVSLVEVDVENRLIVGERRLSFRGTDWYCYDLGMSDDGSRVAVGCGGFDARHRNVIIVFEKGQVQPLNRWRAEGGIYSLEMDPLGLHVATSTRGSQLDDFDYEAAVYQVRGKSLQWDGIPQPATNGRLSISGNGGDGFLIFASLSGLTEGLSLPSCRNLFHLDPTAAVPVLSGTIGANGKTSIQGALPDSLPLGLALGLQGLIRGSGCDLSNPLLLSIVP